MIGETYLRCNKKRLYARICVVRYYALWPVLKRIEASCTGAQKDSVFMRGRGGGAVALLMG